MRSLILSWVVSRWSLLLTPASTQGMTPLSDHSGDTAKGELSGPGPAQPVAQTAVRPLLPDSTNPSLGLVGVQSPSSQGDPTCPRVTHCDTSGLCSQSDIGFHGPSFGYDGTFPQVGGSDRGIAGVREVCPDPEGRAAGDGWMAAFLSGLL